MKSLKLDLAEFAVHVQMIDHREEDGLDSTRLKDIQVVEKFSLVANICKTHQEKTFTLAWLFLQKLSPKNHSEYFYRIYTSLKSCECCLDFALKRTSEIIFLQDYFIG